MTPTHVNARPRALTFAILLGICALVPAGCSGPDKANVIVRKENAELREKLAASERSREGDRATIESLQKEKGTLPTLPKERLDRLFTVHGLQFRRLTGPSDNGIKVYIMPVDAAGDPIKAAGSFTVDLFDLSASKENRIGHWEFSMEQLRNAWFDQPLLRGYVLDAPWQTMPTSKDLTVRVVFKDELTQRTFNAQREMKLEKLPTTRSSLAPSPSGRGQG